MRPDAVSKLVLTIMCPKFGVHPLQVGTVTSLAAGGINMCMDSDAHFEGPVAAKECGGRCEEVMASEFERTENR